MKTLSQIVKSVKRVAAPLAVIALLSSPNQLKAREPNNEVYTFFNAGFDYVNQGNIARLSNVPESIRNVPAHRDDMPWPTYLAPINDVPLKYSKFSILIPVSFGIGCKIDAYLNSHLLDIRAGVDVNCPIFELSGDIETRNYSGGKKRGVGEALTYYGFDSVFLDGINSFTPGIFCRVSKEKDIFGLDDTSLFLEYHLSLWNLAITNGWDRYNKLERKKTYELADVTQHTMKIGIEKGFASLFLGYAITQSKPTFLGKKTNLKLYNYFTIGLECRGGFRQYKNEREWSE